MTERFVPAHDAIRALHFEVGLPHAAFCRECEKPFPCPTVLALDTPTQTRNLFDDFDCGGLDSLTDDQVAHIRQCIIAPLSSLLATARADGWDKGARDALISAADQVGDGATTAAALRDMAGQIDAPHDAATCPDCREGFPYVGRAAAPSDRA